MLLYREKAEFVRGLFPSNISYIISLCSGELKNLSEEKNNPLNSMKGKYENSLVEGLVFEYTLRKYLNIIKNERTKKRN
eukprot:snap_masked-scaffold_21-processed-gene-1.13-mRNA-1 protein AED:1.00 eAED:1.00 QI:0/-1/0/0/-1/1/1/0/78